MMTDVRNTTSKVQSLEIGNIEKATTFLLIVCVTIGKYKNIYAKSYIISDVWQIFSSLQLGRMEIYAGDVSSMSIDRSCV